MRTMNSKTQTIAAVVIAAFAGAAVTMFLLKTADAQGAKTIFKFSLAAKLQRFEVVAGKEEKFKEWMDYLRRNRVAAAATLEGERTYFEAVFSDKSGDGMTYAYWLTLKGEGGKSVESSTSELDKKHLEYWNECIKKGSRKVFDGEFYLTPEFLDQTIAQHQKLDGR